MATISKRGDSYQIRVSVGYDTKGNHKEQAMTMTWKPPKGLTEKQIRKELNRQAVMFEEACMRGFTTKEVKFEDLCEEWFEEYAQLNLRSTTYERLKQLKHRIYLAIGHLRVDTRSHPDSFKRSSIRSQRTARTKSTENRLHRKPFVTT